MNTPDLLIPPHSVEAEQSVIGGLLLDNEALDRIADILSADDFYRHDHKVIFEHAVKLIERNITADIVTMAESLESHNELSNVGGIVYIGSLVQNTPSAVNIRRYAEIVLQKSILRRLLCIASELQGECYGANINDPEKIALNAEESIFRLFQKQTGSELQLDDAVKSVMVEIDSRSENSVAGLKTGFKHFDDLAGGLEPGQLIIVAARPSVGKSVFACNVADYVADNEHTVLFHTLEMSSKEIGMRILSSRSGVSMHQMRAGTREHHHWDAMEHSRQTLTKAKLFIDDRPGLAVNQIRAKARRIRRKHGLDLIVVDYLGLMTGKGDNRTQEIGSISRGLKGLAKELNVPIIALAQLNRGVESRQDKRPMMSDLRDSGEVEQDADIIVMLHREELYNSAPEHEGLADLLVRKNRNGPTGDVTLQFRKEIAKFEDSTIQPSQRRKPMPTAAKTRGLD